MKKKRDIGVTISSDLKQIKYCKTDYEKDNTMLAFITTNFEYKTPGIMLTMYKWLVRHDLESTVQFWFPDYRRQ